MTKTLIFALSAAVGYLATRKPVAPAEVTHNVEFSVPGHLLTAALAYETERSGRLVNRIHSN